MPCTIPQDTIEQTIAFHGHSCPGLAIGIRAAELALREIGHNDTCDLVAVVETDMCGVDAIQFLTGCTFGKGNLIHRDHGKMAFSFHDRTTGKGFRAILNPESRKGMDEEMRPLMQRMADGTATDTERQRAASLRESMHTNFMALPLEAMFIIKEVAAPAPRPAKVLESLVCDKCGESTMESRTRRFAGETLCIPCFASVEQKI